MDIWTAKCVLDISFQMYKQMKNTCALGRVHDRTETVISTGEGRSFLPACAAFEFIKRAIRTRTQHTIHKQTIVWCRTLSFQLLCFALLCTAAMLYSHYVNDIRLWVEKKATLKLNLTKQNRKCVYDYFRANAFIISFCLAGARLVPHSCALILFLCLSLFLSRSLSRYLSVFVYPTIDLSFSCAFRCRSFCTIFFSLFLSVVYLFSI